MKIYNFLREIAVVVIGVAITLSASYWITNKNAERDVALYLSAIKMELEDNKRILEETNNKKIQVSINYTDYLESHDKKSLNLDSLIYYRDRTMIDFSPIMLKSNAFEMFKISGFMRLVKDKELLLALWETYSFLVETKQAFDGQQQMKFEELKKYLYLNSLPDEELLKDPPLYDFYANMQIAYIQHGMFNYTLAYINAMIPIIDQAKEAK